MENILIYISKYNLSIFNDHEILKLRSVSKKIQKSIDGLNGKYMIIRFAHTVQKLIDNCFHHICSYCYENYNDPEVNHYMPKTLLLNDFPDTTEKQLKKHFTHIGKYSRQPTMNSVPCWFNSYDTYIYGHNEHYSEKVDIVDWICKTIVQLESNDKYIARMKLTSWAGIGNFRIIYKYLYRNGIV